jgi:hypothetical protein
MTPRSNRKPGAQRRRDLRRRRAVAGLLTLAADGRALYVVNYESGTVTKLRTSDMKPLQTISACYHPIGITYDEPTSRVWVALHGHDPRVRRPLVAWTT